MVPDLSLAVLIAIVSFVSACLGLGFLSFLVRSDPGRALLAAPTVSTSVVFLFDRQDLVDATDPARRLLANAPTGDDDWTRLCGMLATRFPSFHSDISLLEHMGSLTLLSDNQDMRLEAEWVGGLARITIFDDSDRPSGADIDPLSLRAMSDELLSLRVAVEYLPTLIWKQKGDQVTWANGAYLRLVEDVKGQDVAGAWPPPVLFEQPQQLRLERGEASRRISATSQDGEIRWFDHSAVTLEDEVLHMGVPAERVVRAETALRDFLQTLTKTFGHLTIGLAIFDRSRRLVLFNPALTDLTTLDPAFLSRRPMLSEVLDRLREKQMMPEPKDYKSWRQHLEALESAAIEGTYEETWTLPTGQTYRVSGRPHPDGAIAFVIEDISAEISLTRRFRSELETSQAVLDSLDEAIAVFSPVGTLTLSNRAYTEMWNMDPASSLGQVSATEATGFWSEACRPSPVWGEIRDFVSEPTERTEWADGVRGLAGETYHIRVVPITGGGTLVGFRRDEALAELAAPDQASPATEL